MHSITDSLILIGDNNFVFQKLFVMCIAMHFCFGLQSYYYISHASCVCA